MIVKATYTGSNDSRGFKKGKEYIFDVLKNPFQNNLTAIKTADGLSCIYTSAMSFLMNWSNVQVINTHANLLNKAKV